MSLGMEILYLYKIASKSVSGCSNNWSNICSISKLQYFRWHNSKESLNALWQLGFNLDMSGFNASKFFFSYYIIRVSRDKACLVSTSNN